MTCLTKLLISPDLTNVKIGFFQYSFPPSPVYPITLFLNNAASIGGMPSPSKSEKT